MRPAILPRNSIPQIGDRPASSSVVDEDIALLVRELNLVVTKARIRFGSGTWEVFFQDAEPPSFLSPGRTRCEEPLCEEGGSSCRQLNGCSVGSPVDTVIACLLKVGQ